MSWFVKWFNSPYYHILYKHRDFDEAERFIDNLLLFLRPQKNSTVLDLACGRGRHARYLHAHGLNVTGLDLSTESIAYAKRFSEANLTFGIHDMRNPIIGNYTYIFNLFTSFGYFEKEDEHLQVIRNMANALPPGGILVIDYLNVEKVARNLITKEEKIIKNIQFQLERKTENGFIVKNIAINDQGKKSNFYEKVRALSLADFERYFSAAGLSLHQVYGNYNLTPFTKNSDRMILIAKKDQK